MAGGRVRLERVDVVAAPTSPAALQHRRVRASRVVEDVGGQLARVVRTEDLGAGPREDRVQQALVPHRFDCLGLAAADPDRLADEAYRPLSVFVDESLDKGDDPGRIDPDLTHVGELHASAEVAERRPEHGELRLGHGDQHCSTPFDAAAREIADRSDVLLVSGVEQRVVVEHGGRPGIASRCRRFLPTAKGAKRANEQSAAVSSAGGSGTQRAMGLTVSLLLAAAGAILIWAVNTTASGFNIHTAGVILLVIGVVGFVVSLVFWSSWGGFGGVRRADERDMIPR